MADLQRKTANLFDGETASGYYNDSGVLVPDSTTSHSTTYIPVNGTTYTVSGLWYRAGQMANFAVYEWDNNKNWLRRSNRQYPPSSNEITFAIGTDASYITLQVQTEHGNIMLNSGSTSLPYEPYWLHSLRKLTTATDIITSLPADLYADGTNATVGLQGNMSQTGTPTPDNPIQPSETGDLSENLYDASNPNIFKGYYDLTTNRLIGNPTNAFIYIPLVQGKKYYIYGAKRYNASLIIRWVTVSSVPSNAISCIRTGTFAQTDIFTITAEANENNLALFLCGDSDYSTYGTVEDAIATNGANLTIDNGYKLTISSANTTTPVYLGEVESTRRIKKYEFTGQESDLRIQANITATNAIQLPTTLSDYKRESFVCSHMPIIDSSTNPNTHGFAGQFLTLCFDLSMGLDTLEKVRTYLQQQYANGTPVTVWYVLATEETGIVNEPIRKIGNYADAVSGISIPTITGKDTFDVETTLKPSEVSLSYTGWHDASVKEKSENLFDYQTMALGETGKYLKNDGTTQSEGSWAISDYIPCNGTTFALGKIGGNTPSICFYDANKQFISGQAYNTGGANTKVNISATAISTARYIRFSYMTSSYPDDLSAIMLNIGSTALPYEPYWK